MICPNCNANIADNSTFCTECGVQVQPTTPTDAPETPTEENQTAEDNRRKLLLALCAVVGIILMIFIFNSISSPDTESALKGKWYYVDISDNYEVDTRLVLEIGRDDIELRWEASPKQTFFSGKYEVVSSDTIKINRFGTRYETFYVEFTDNKKDFFIYPSITGYDGAEMWTKTKH